MGIEHLAEQVIATQFLLLTPEYQLTLEPQLRCDGGCCTAMVALQGTCSHEYRASGSQRFSRQKLELSYLIASQ
jgi:hypothetical protein